MCVYARVFVRARLRSHDGYPSLAVFVALLCPALSTPLPWLSQCLYHRCKENKTLTHTFSLFCSFSIEHVRDGVTEPRGRSVAKEEHSSQGVCASVFVCVCVCVSVSVSDRLCIHDHSLV